MILYRGIIRHLHIRIYKRVIRSFRDSQCVCDDKIIKNEKIIYLFIYFKVDSRLVYSECVTARVSLYFYLRVAFSLKGEI